MRTALSLLSTAAIAALTPVAATFPQVPVNEGPGDQDVSENTIAPCDSLIYCQGEMLNKIQLAKPYADSKEFVDKPTKASPEKVLAAFSDLEKLGPISKDALNDFLDEYFGPVGQELVEVNETKLHTSPDFLANVSNWIVGNFTQQVVDIWPSLTRRYTNDQDTNCSECVNSFLPVANEFVIAGGRFREPYYWDSFFIIEGLLRSKGAFTGIAKGMIENFLDSVKQRGFVPNGFRQYYLNRSQPPLLTQMVRIYVEYTGDTSILSGEVDGLKLLVEEYNFFMKNRTAEVEYCGEHYTLNRYNVANNQPRPESYNEDWQTANNNTKYSADMELTEAKKAQLYANLASGAESGWDYSGGRWLRVPEDTVSGDKTPLRSLNVVETIPVELNSILYFNEITIGNFYRDYECDHEEAEMWYDRAAQRRQAMHALLWNEEYYSYFDYNMTSQAQNIFVPLGNATSQPDNAPPGQQIILTPSQFFPFWTGAADPELTENPANLRKAYQRIRDTLETDTNPGGIAATNYFTGQQWDKPNVWPPLQYALMQGLVHTLDMEQLSEEPDEDSQWLEDTVHLLAQRYVDSTFCTWRETGGAIAPWLPKLDTAEKNATGIMFEKYADNTTVSAGGGGEYEVVEGFGWTNGVLIWTVDKFSEALKTPNCGNATYTTPVVPL